MVFNNIQENIDNVVSQVKKAKSRGKKSIKVKVYQIDMTGGKAHGLFMVAGMLEGGKGMKALEEMGYKVSYERTDKQLTVGYNCRGEVNKSVMRPLKTTTMVVHF